MIIGIDPGQTGAIAILRNGSEVEIFDYPGDERALQEIVRKISVPTVAILEYQQSMPMQGVSSTFALGVNYGIWLATLAARGWPVRIVRPAVWKKCLGYPAKVLGQAAAKRKQESKAYSLTLARRLYPAAAKYLARAKDHNRAEALLIAHYGKGEDDNAWCD